MAKLGTLILDVRTNTAKFSQGMDRVDKKIGNFSRAAKKLTATLAVLGGAAGLGAIVKRNLEIADSFGKAADTVALSVESYQELAFAANLAGVEQSQFTSNMTAFVKRVGEARANTGPLVSFLKKYDETLLDSIKNTTSQEQALNLIANAIQRAATETDRAAIANAAFSRAGVQMTIALRDGEKGLNQVRARARELGIILDAELVRGAEQASDRLEEMGKVLSLKLTKAVAENADTLEDLATGIIDLVDKLTKGIEKLNQFGEALGTNLANKLHKVDTPLDLVRKRIENIREQIEEANEVINDKGFLGFGGSTDKEIEAAKSQLVELNKQLEKQLRLRDQVLKNTVIGVAPVSAAPEGTAKSTQETQNADPITGLDLGKIRDNLEKRFDIIETALLNERELSEAKYEEDRFALESALNDQAISYQEYYSRLRTITKAEAQERAKIEAQTQQYITDARQGALQAGVGFLRTFSQESKTAAKLAIIVNKAVSIAQAIQNTAVAATKSLTYDVTGATAARIKAYGAVQVGLIAATGLAQLSQVGTSAGGLGTPSNPISVEPTNTGTQNNAPGARGTTSVQVIAENIYGVEHLDQVITDAIKRAVNDRDEIIVDINSRNGRELAQA